MLKKPAIKDLRMYGPLLDALREVGGEAPGGEIARIVADRVLGGTTERDEELKSGGNAAENEVAWACSDLKVAGLIDGSRRGIWMLTPEGWKTELDVETGRTLRQGLRQIRRRIREEAKANEQDGEETSTEQVAPFDDDPPEGPSLIETLRNLPPQGFERLCQRILREAGFAEVTVTGKSNDGGIDGHGVLQINELVSFNVLFQCKRYEGSVGSPEIRNFRGAMTGRTDKGIFLTTGSFSSEAQKEAVRDGAPPIELVDHIKLVSLMERLQIGVKPRVVYDVDEEFFEPFRGS